MAYDWITNSEIKEGGGRANKIPAGKAIELTIAKVLYAKPSTGVVFQSANNDPQILLVLSDADGNEAGAMITLSARAAWKLAQILLAAGKDLNKLSGKEPDIFATPQYGDMLIGLKFIADLRWKKRPNSEEEDAEIYPIRPQPGQAAQQANPAQPAAQPPRQQKPAAAPAPAMAATGFNPEDDMSFKDGDIPF